MLARFWSANTTSALAESYLHHFAQIVQPQLRKLDGFLGAAVCTRPLPAAVEIVVITYWQSFTSIDAFAGADRESAVVAPEAAALLTDFDKRVRHYEVPFANFPGDAPF